MKNILKDYPQPKKPRYLKKNFRSFKDTLIASYRDKEFYNGSRSTGYGGYKYDGRWASVARNCNNLYKLKNNSKILHLNCDYGFLLYDLKKLNSKFKLFGTETSKYAIKNSMIDIKKNISYIRPIDIKFKKKYFDLVIALGVVYTLNLPDAILMLKNISHFSKNSFVTLACYKTDEEKYLFEKWTLGGNLCLKREEWKQIFKEAGYKGDYLFIDSNYLNLKLQK